MKKRIQRTALYLLLSITTVFALTGCGSTRVQEGVTIEKKSGNPLKFW